MLNTETWVHCPAPAEVDLPMAVISQVQPAEPQQAKPGRWHSVAAVIGNVLTGGLFLAGMLWLPMGLQQLLDWL
jgi:hypothetical protein